MTPAPRPGTSPPATATRAAVEGDVATLLRRALLVLAAAGTVGTAVELAMLRHWTSPVQLIPWVAVVVLAATVAALVRPARPSTVRAVRVAAIAVTVAALIGVVEHVLANHEAGPLDFRYASTWARLSPARRWWLSATGGVGPSPSLAPLVLVQSAVCLWLATIGHPARPARSVAEAAPAAGHGRPLRSPPTVADGQPGEPGGAGRRPGQEAWHDPRHHASSPKARTPPDQHRDPASPQRDRTRAICTERQQ